MMHCFRVAASRGVSWGVILMIALSVLAALGMSHVAVDLRRPEDQNFAGETLNSAVLAGLILPVAVLTRLLQDRMAWAVVTSPRNVTRQRAGWFICWECTAFVCAVAVGTFAPASQHPILVSADLAFLAQLGMIGAVALGAPLGWLIPTIVALAFSTPGIVPIRYNYLALASRAHVVAMDAALLALLAGLLFVLLDDYGVARRRRLIERTPGVTEE